MRNNTSDHSTDADGKTPTARREGNFEGYGDIELFFQTWARPQNDATLVLTHGLAEHSECYAQTAESLVQSGWNVCAWDLRGHGKSDGKRGFVGDFHDYSRDLGKLLSFLKASDRLKDNFALVGHSMGGLISLRYLVEDKPSHPVPKALALSSPLLGIAVKVSPVKDLASRLLNRLMPTVTLHNDIQYDQLTRDSERLKNYGTDPLRHDKISSGVYLGMIENIEVVKSLANRITLPTLVQAAGKDTVVSTEATREFFAEIGAKDKKLIVYDESYHEIYNDLDRESVFKDLNAFLALHLRSANA